jgi:hypothetical protein
MVCFLSTRNLESSKHHHITEAVTGYRIYLSARDKKNEESRKVSKGFEG